MRNSKTIDSYVPPEKPSLYDDLAALLNLSGSANPARRRSLTARLMMKMSVHDFNVFFSAVTTMTRMLDRKDMMQMTTRTAINVNDFSPSSLAVIFRLNSFSEDLIIQNNCYNIVCMCLLFYKNNLRNVLEF